MTADKRIVLKHRLVLYVSLTTIVVLSVVFGYRFLRSGSNAGPPNVLLITVDALRADRLGCYGYRLDTSPNIDQLAQRGVLFTDCTVQWPKTQPSMASLFTGMYPKTNGIKWDHRALPSSFELMSEIFKKAGYRTGAVIANINIGKTFGFDQGFDYFVESWQQRWKEKAGDSPFLKQAGAVKFFTDATVVTDESLKWLEEKQESKKPFFLWLHYMEPHGPYLPPRTYSKYFRKCYKFEPVPQEKLPKYQLQKFSETDETITDIGHYRAQYDREIRYFDDELARLLREISKLDKNRKTVIVLTADHGESFSEHNYYLEHGQFSYQACAHVPLIIVKDGVLPKGKTVDKPVGLIDVSVTVLELAGIDVPVTFEGQSLVNLMLDEKNTTARDYTFMESGYHKGFPQLTVRYDRWKLIHIQSQYDLALMTGAEYELYDVYSDPGEVHNLADEKPNIVAELSEVLHKWHTSGPRYVEKGTEIDVDTLDPKDVEMLKSLGYVK